MGCCLSANKASSAGENDQHSSKVAYVHGSDTSNSRGCVPLMEEETVKEVLSETPTPKPAIAKIELEEKTITPTKPALQKIEEEVEIEKKKMKTAPVIVPEEISEVSEICSLSESMSTTTIATERRDDDERSRDDGEVRQRVDRSAAKHPRNRSFSGELSGKRDRVVGRSPARRSDPSPGRRNDAGVRSVLGREGNQSTARRRIATNVHRRESGESSARRSRSPATRTDGGASRSALGRSPSTRKMAQSPSRVRSTPPENSKSRGEGTSKEGKWPSSNESLENPLVSLECFIFL